VVKGGWQVRALVMFVAVTAGMTILAQACGGGSATEDVTPTTAPTSTAGSETPTGGQPFGRGDGGASDMPDFTPGAGMPDITPGAGPPGQALLIGGASEEFAAFLGISLEQLQSELSAEGATPGSMAEAHGRTREELKTFFMEQTQAQISDAVAAGTTSQEDADRMLEALASRIDDIIDGKMPSGGPGPLPIEPTPEGR